MLAGAGVPSIPPRGCHPSQGMPSALPSGAGCEEWGVCPGPAGEHQLSWSPSKIRSPQGSLLRRLDRGWGALGGRVGKLPPCRLASLLPFPCVDFRRSRLDGEDADAGVTCGHHVPMSPGTCLAPCSRAWHQPSCVTGAGTAGSGSFAPSPAAQDGPSGSLSLAGSHLGQRGLHPCACAPSLPVCSNEGLDSLWLVSFMLKRSHFRAFTSILLLVFRDCCLKCFHVPFSSSLFYPRDPLWGGSGGEMQQGSRCSVPGQAPLWLPRPLFLGYSLLVIDRVLGLG